MEEFLNEELHEKPDFENEEDSSEDLFEHHKFTIDKGQEPMRIDKWIFNRIGFTSRNRIQNAADSGNILVNEKPVKPSYKVKPYDVISIVMPYPPRDTAIYPENIPLDIVFEDDDILLVNKQSNMVVHPGHGNYSGTLVNGLAWHFKNLPNFEAAEFRPGLVHRIDKNTTGLLVIAKTDFALTYLAKQFYDHSIDRTYRALVWGTPAENEGTISTYIGRGQKDRKIMEVYTDPEKGKWAVTHYKVIESFGYVSLLEFKLETGRTHQIRIHCKHMGHSIFNDTDYGGEKIQKGTIFTKYKQFIENCFTLMPRLALHAKSLGFTHPSTKERIFFEIELPNDYLQLIEKWRKYAHNTDLSSQ